MPQPDPADFPHRLLLAVVGLTPQVVTETLYALMMLRGRPFEPTAIRLVTTAEGANRIRLLLLDEDGGRLHQLAADYGGGTLRNAVAGLRIDVLHDDAGRALADIASPADGMNAADRIAAIVREETTDPDKAVFASIAGGRKTMGFLLGYALSLFGRPQDRLTHVLVDAPFQDHPEFFYPPPKPRVLQLRDRRPARTDAAAITLTDIPFVRLREGLPARLLDGRARFAATVAAAQAAFSPAGLVVEVAMLTLRCGTAAIRLPPVDLAFVLWLARRRLAGLPHGGAVYWGDADAEDFLDAYLALPEGRRGQYDRIARALRRQGVERAWVEERVNRLNKLVKDALGPAVGPYGIVSTGRRPYTRYGLALELKNIMIDVG